MTTRNQVAITMGVGFGLIVAVLIGVLLQAPAKPIATNSVVVRRELGLLSPHTRVCPADERLPASTDAVRVSLIAYPSALRSR